MVFNIEKLRRDLITKRVIELDVSLSVVAKQTEISKATLSRIENAKLPDVETFAKLTIWLGTNAMSYFVIPAKKQNGFTPIKTSNPQ